MPVMFAPYQGSRVGADFQSLSPGFLIRGMGVDNPSGSWLFISSLNSYIPPYTLGYRSTIKPGALNISVSYTAGPGGQLSTILGAPASISLYSEPVVDAPGAPFLNANGTPLSSVSIIPTAGYTELNGSPLAIGQMGTNTIAAFYGLTSAIKLTTVTVVNLSPSAAIVSVARLLNDVVTGGWSDTPAPTDPTNPVFPGLCRIAPTIIGVTTNEIAASATHNVVLPTNILAGDAIIVGFQASAVIRSPSVAPAGYTLVGNLASTSSNAIYQKTAVLADAGATVTLVWNGISTGVAFSLVVRAPNATPGYTYASALYSAVTTVPYGAVNLATPPGIILTLAWNNTKPTSWTTGAGKETLISYIGTAVGLLATSRVQTVTGSITPVSDTVAPSSSGVQASVALQLSPIIASIGASVVSSASIPAGGSLVIDLNATNLIGGAGAGFAIVGSTTGRLQCAESLAST